MILQNWNEVLLRYCINIKSISLYDRLNLSQIILFPHMVNNVVYDCWFEAITIEENVKDEWSFDNITVTVKWDLVISDGSQTTIIASGEQIVDQWIGRRYVESLISGFYKSLYENSFLIITKHTFVGIGLEIDQRIDMHGFYLNVGF